MSDSRANNAAELDKLQSSVLNRAAFLCLGS